MFAIKRITGSLQLYNLLLISVVLNVMNAKYVMANKGYYIVNEGVLQWQEAEDYCAQKGMHLVSIESADESNFLKNLIQQRYGKLQPFWTGGHVMNNTWYWIGTGQKIKHFFWHAGEPNDLNSKEGCIHTWVNKFDWNDDRCNEMLYFICEIQ